MLTKEGLDSIVGVAIFVAAASILSLVLNANLILSAIIGAIMGIIAGFATDWWQSKKMEEATKDKIDLAFRIVAWGLIGFAVFVIILKFLGIIHSPPEVTLESMVGVGALVELGRLDIKTSLLWNEFKRKKKL